MKRIIILFLYSFPLAVFSQTIVQELDKAIKQLQADSQCKHAVISMYVVDSKTGKVIFNKNADLGLAPASCQKLITSTAAFELLGKDYHFKTELLYSGTIKDGILTGDLVIKGNGDPTLGSWRWTETKDQLILKKMIAAVIAKKIKKITGKIISGTANWDTNSIPGGWVWDDIGNYYGAGASAMNWRENQYDLRLESGVTIGSIVTIEGTTPRLVDVKLISEVTAAKKGSGDNAYIYLAPQSSSGFVKGTIPVDEENFIISGSIPDPAKQFQYELKNALKEESNIELEGADLKTIGGTTELLLSHLSPPLDRINYWFLKKSVNMFGEALLKTIAFEKAKLGSTEKGIELIQEFWSQHGIESSAINIKDGSGLSPANRVTAKGLVTVLQFAKQQSWFTSFFSALPEINAIKMKDGYIADVRSYSGYIKSKNGNEYTFSFIVNNFSGSASSTRVKMWKVLDILK